MNATEFLASLDQIPDLLELARQQDDLHRYQVQDRLRQQYRQQGRPFLYSMPMRHLTTCPLCEKRFTDILHELEDPRREAKINIPELVLHEARFHETPPGEELTSFLEECLTEDP